MTTMTKATTRDDDDGLEMHDNSCGECGHPYKAGDETHYPECSRLAQPERVPDEHTPLPWRVGNKVSVPFDEPDVPDVFITDDESGNTLAVATAHGDHNTQANANAQLIVTAVNSHAHLVAALETVQAWLVTPATDRKTLAQIQAVVNDALSRVRG